jgi:hypothetical protein
MMWYVVHVVIVVFKSSKLIGIVCWIPWKHVYPTSQEAGPTMKN